MNEGNLHFRAGDIVEVRSEAEILATLAGDGTLDGLPFMPEMQKFCRKKFRVFKRADKICVEEDWYIGIKRMRNAVLLEEVRCDGEDHDGCQRMCLIFWKEAWLKPLLRGQNADPPMNLVSRPVRTTLGPIDTSKTYFCQSTSIRHATEFMSGWDIRQYVRDLISKSLTPMELLKVLFFALYNKVARRAGIPEFGAIMGKEGKTPVISLNLQPGEIVEVKNESEIAATLDRRGRNRGLTISHEMLRHCGRRFRVLRRVDRMILETTGRMREIQGTVLLQGTACSGLCVRGCARNSHPMWREAWLKRVDIQAVLIPTALSSEL